MLGESDKFPGSQSPKWVLGVYTSIRSHKHQNGSKAESIWMRFSKGQNRKDFAGVVYYSLLRQSEALAGTVVASPTAARQNAEFGGGRHKGVQEIQILILNILICQIRASCLVRSLGSVFLGL